MTPFTEKIVHIIKTIPPGKVMTYGQIAKLAGNSRGARQVSRILHSMSKKYNLPWHRVINSKGIISLKDEGYKIQRCLLEKEGILFNKNGGIDLIQYQHKSYDEFII